MAVSTSRPPCPPDWRSVVLTEAEEAAALVAGQQLKWHQLKRAQHVWDMANPPKARPLAPDELATAVQAKAATEGLRLVIDEYNRAAWDTLCAYFALASEAPGPDSPANRGLLLVGPVGCGKTTLLRLFGAVISQHKFGPVSARSLAGRFVSEGPAGLEPYLSQHYSGAGLCLDDIGTETVPVKHYGTECNAVAEVLLARYDEWQAGRLAGSATHLTTNLPVGKPDDAPGAATLYGTYGRRVGDRLREMFRLVAFPAAAPSRRGRA